MHTTRQIHLDLTTIACTNASDLDQAARTCASASGEAVCVDSLMVDTVHAKLPVHAATKKTKLKGKAKMQVLGL